MESSPFKEALQKITDKRQDELHEKPAEGGAGASAGSTSKDAAKSSAIYDDANDDGTFKRGDGTVIDDPDGKLPSWKTFAERKVREWVKFVVLPATENQLGEHIKTEWSAGQTTMKDDEHCLIIYDVPSSGEPTTHPRIRIAPLRQEHIRTCVRGALIGRGNRDAINPNDLYLFFDGGRHGNQATLVNTLSKEDGRACTRDTTTFYIVHEEQSVKNRKSKQRGVVSQMEFLHVVTSSGFPGVEDKPRLHFQGTARGNVISPVALPAWETLWMVTNEMKDQMFGACRVRIGGPTDDPEAPPQFGPASDLEPVNWHARSSSLWEEICHSFKAKKVLMLTGLDEILPLVCIRKRIPICVVVFTEFAQEEL
eukprot:9191448-Pyramimonas_sp.AAC.1